MEAPVWELFETGTRRQPVESMMDKIYRSCAVAVGYVYSQ